MTPSIIGRKPRLLFVNRSYWPDAEATGQLLSDLCESLVDRFEVSVLCGQPNSNPTKAVYQCSGSQLHRGVMVHRIDHTRFNKRRSSGRIANLISFTLAARRWLKTSAAYDVIVSETDPFLLPLVVSPHAQKCGAAYVAYLQDVYPDIAVRLGRAKNGMVTRWLRRRLCHAYQQARLLVVLSPNMKDELAEWGIDAAAIKVVPNWVNCLDVKPVKQSNGFRTSQNWDDSFVVMHSGNMGLSQKLCSLIEAAEHSLFPRNAKLALVGGGADERRLRQLAARSSRRDDIRFLPYQPREALSESLSAADVHVISVDPRIGGTMMPSKLYGILASGTPVVVIADPRSDVARVVSENAVGVVAKSHDPAEIAAAIATIATLTTEQRTQMQERARRLAETDFDKSICVDQFAKLLHGVLNTPSETPTYVGSR
ncbi:MAG: glycosyltransferase family 4 protein [Planctomycetaceae bacterium]